MSGAGQMTLLRKAARLSPYPCDSAPTGGYSTPPPGMEALPATRRPALPSHSMAKFSVAHAATDPLTASSMSIKDRPVSGTSRTEDAGTMRRLITCATLRGNTERIERQHRHPASRAEREPLRAEGPLATARCQIENEVAQSADRAGGMTRSSDQLGRGKKSKSPLPSGISAPGSAARRRTLFGKKKLQKS